MNSKVTVIIPFYNRNATIVRAINSILQPGNLEFVGEVIIVDDGSESKEAEILKTYIELMQKTHADLDVEFTLIRNNENVNAAYARNVGIKASNFDIITFLDSDDEWIELKLSKQLAQLKSNTIIFCQYAKKSSETQLVKSIHPSAFTNSNVADYLLTEDGHIQTTTMIMYKSVTEKVLFNPKLKKYQDWDFAIRAWGLGVEFKFINEALVNYYVDSSDRIGNIISEQLVDDFLQSIDNVASAQTKQFFKVSATLWTEISKGNYVTTTGLLFRYSTLKAMGLKRTLETITYFLKVIVVRFKNTLQKGQ